MSAHHNADYKKRKRPHGDEREGFEELAKKYPDFAKEYESVRAKQKQGGGCSFSSVVTQEFNIALTRALMHTKFNVILPSLPTDRLCPPVPNRLTYVKWLQEDLLPLLCENNDYFATKEPLRHCGLDIGTGASCIYPFLFTCNNREWNMIGTEIDHVSIESARANVNANELQDRIQVQLVEMTGAQQQSESAEVSNSGSDRKMTGAQQQSEGTAEVSESGGDRKSSEGPIARAFECCSAGDEESLFFDFCMTNPPFFDTTKDIEPRADERERTPMTDYEGAYPGGEVGFVCDMIRDSLVLRDRVGWYSAMFGKKGDFVRGKKILTRLLGKGHVQFMEVSPGYMTRWFLAWTFRRPKIDSPLTQATKQALNFEVDIEDKPDAGDAVDEVVSRISTYCEMLPGWKLLTSVATKENGMVVRIVEAPTAPTEDCGQVHNTEQLPERLFDVIYQDWDISMFLPEEGHFLVEVCVTETRQKVNAEKAWTVAVSVNCYEHSNRGGKAVEKIRSQLQGEICRSNRRWRRLLKRQAEQRPTTSVSYVLELAS